VLLADAAHMAADAAGVGLSLLAAHFAGKPATERRTFGYARAEILAATPPSSWSRRPGGSPRRRR
jgi:cobalt-zinc-cadmium efflux system protein